MRMGKKRQSRKKSCPLGASGENIIGYCALHHCCLSKKQMQNRKCLEKHCKRFVMRKDHPYWQRREEIKEARKQRKDAQRSAAAGGDANDLQALSPPATGV